MNYPKDNIRNPMIKFVESLPKEQTIELKDLGGNPKQRYDLLEYYSLWFFLMQDITIVFFEDKNPIQSSWDWKTKTYKKHEIVKSLRIHNNEFEKSEYETKR